MDDVSMPWLRSKPGKKWSEVDEDVLAAWVADMDFPPPPAVREALAADLERGDLGYPTDDFSLEGPFRDRMRSRFGWSPLPGRVREFTDVLNGLEAILSTVTRPGDAIAVHAPIYPPFLDAFARLELVPKPIPFQRTATGWGFDPEQARQAIGASQVVLVVNPHNPTGRSLTLAELEVLSEAALTARALVIADEVWADLVYPGRTHVPIAKVDPEIARITVTLSSATKAYNLAGVRHAIGHIGHAELWRRLVQGPRHVFGLVSNLGRTATLAAWRRGDGWLEGILRTLDGNRRRISEHLVNHLPELGYVSPEATYLAWLDFRRFELGDDPAAWLEDNARVRLSSGPEFGPQGAGFARLNFATSGPILDAILIRIRSAITSR